MEPFPHGKTGAQPEILQRDDRMIGDEGDGRARPPDNAGIRRGEATQFRLRAIAKQRAAEHRNPLLGQQISTEVSLRAVDNCILQAEFPGQAAGGKNIVGAVGVEMHGQLPLHHGEERLIFRVEFRLVGLLILSGPPACPGCTGPRPRAAPG